MGIGNRVINFFRLEKEDPDYGNMEYRGGAPVVPPQEFDNEGNAPRGAFQGRSGAVPGRSEAVPPVFEAVPPRSRGVPGLFWRFRRAVPKDRIDAMWWAKSARNVVWRGSEPLRIALFLGGAVVLLAMTWRLRPAREIATAALVLAGIFLAGDPFRTIRRRVAIQTRLLAAGFLGLVVMTIWIPKAPAFAVLAVYGILSAGLILICNTEWLVETTYMASESIYDAMRKDPDGPAMKSWEAGGAKTAMTFCSEYGSFITSAYMYRMVQGIYILAWLRGRDYVPEDEEERVVWYNGCVRKGATQEDYDALWRKLEDMKRDTEERETEWQDSEKKLERDLEEARFETFRREKQIRTLLDRIDELEADAEAAEKERKENERDLRLGRIRRHYDEGSRSARDIAARTGYPVTTVQRIITPWKAEDGIKEEETGREEAAAGSGKEED